MQIKHIENICCRLNDIIAEAKSCVNNKCRIYQCTSIAAGIIIGYTFTIIQIGGW